ncbi:SHOCT domain-containing protein [Zunongwangia sp. F363]|uniref:SHOCT domain-containing protein n=1 Tax=Autumnicola tepida TaxID=3075595 RepID=A0ABU3C898_9FLAO|nr:SHOCT domain-containing protein [Zunongwangia sp. F363]MDT0642564.1 SHOCT domain-containing protein [Zunongwangia sp. F363]
MVYNKWDWLILIGVIVLSIFIYAGRKKKKRKEAIKILDERYAKGEIREEEYEKSKTMIYDGKH